MRKMVLGSVAAGVLGTAVMVAATVPAAAQGMNNGREIGFSGSTGRDNTPSDIARGTGVGNPGSWSGSRNWSGGSRWSDRRYYRRHRNAGVVIGLGALAAPAPYYYSEPYVDDGAIAYCMSRYRSYDPRSGTYLGYDGLRHPCP